MSEPTTPGAQVPAEAEKIMEQAQVFASAWSLVGGRFDSGNAFDEAQQAKDELRQMVLALVAPPQPDRAVMQQALDALEAITRHFGIVRLGESRLADTNVRCDAHTAMAALRAALSATQEKPHAE